MQFEYFFLNKSESLNAETMMVIYFVKSLTENYILKSVELRKPHSGNRKQSLR